MTHGFNKDITGSVVRSVILKYFQLIENGLVCTKAQKAFFKKYKNAYHSKGERFVEFTQL